jgi:hypothetical protein
MPGGSIGPRTVTRLLLGDEPLGMSEETRTH